MTSYHKLQGDEKEQHYARPEDLGYRERSRRRRGRETHPECQDVRTVENDEYMNCRHKRWTYETGHRKEDTAYYNPEGEDSMKYINNYKVK